MAEQAEYFDYLFKLRDSGVTNMWGAGPYLAEEFGLSEREAKGVLIDWIKSFKD